MKNNNNFVHGSYFFGNKISDYGLKNGYVDFATLCKSFDMVLNNDLMDTLESNGYYFENVNIPDFSDEINELEEKIDNINNDFESCYYANDYMEVIPNILNLAERFDLLDEWENCENSDQKEDFLRKIINMAEGEINELNEKINDLRDYEITDIFQYFIIPENGADIIKQWTNYPLYYCETLDLYILGVTHWGTAWNYVLTDIRCNVPYEENEN